MKRIKFSLDKLSDPKTIQRCKDLEATVSADPNMKNAPEALTDLKAAIAAAENQVTASGISNAAAKEATGKKDLSMKALRGAAGLLINYLQYTSQGDELVIRSYGLDTRKVRTPAAVPGTPLVTSATAGDYAGRLDLRWNRLAGAKHYEVEYCMDPMSEAGWKNCPTVTKSRAVLEGLASGSRVWVRVRGANSIGQGAWSNPFSRIVP